MATNGMIFGWEKIDTRHYAATGDLAGRCTLAKDGARWVLTLDGLRIPMPRRARFDDAEAAIKAMGRPSAP